MVECVKQNIIQLFVIVERKGKDESVKFFMTIKIVGGGIRGDISKGMEVKNMLGRIEKMKGTGIDRWDRWECLCVCHLLQEYLQMK